MVTSSGDLWTFTIQHPTAHAMWLLGDFNNWSTTATPMRRVGPHTWQVVQRITGQVCRYCFFAWLPDRGHGVVLRDPGDARPGDAPFLPAAVLRSPPAAADLVSHDGSALPGGTVSEAP